MTPEAMNIGVDARPLTYDLTGIGVYVDHLLRQLQAADSVNRYYLISNGPIRHELKNARWEKIEGNRTSKWASTFWMQTRAPVLAKKLNLDLFWGTRHHLPLLLPKKTKTVVNIYDVTHLVFPKTMNVPNLLVERLLMQRSIKRANYVIALSKSTAKGLEDYCHVHPNKLVTIYPGNPDFPETAGNRDQTPGGIDLPQKYFLFVGTLDPRKNLVRTIQAFERFRPELHDTYLVVVGGKGWKKRKLEKAVDQSPNKQRIIFLGYVTRAQLKAIYGKALCLLFPSLYEGFGLPILEAMSCGTPVITANGASMPEAAGDAAILVDPYDIDAIVAAMIQITTNATLKDSLIAKGYERLGMFSWRQCAEETLRTLQRALTA